MSDAHRIVMEAAIIESLERQSALAMSAGLCGSWRGRHVCCEPGKPGSCGYSEEIGPEFSCQCCDGCRAACARDV